MLNIPLALLQLTREKTRLFVALTGVAFAVILMFMQLGFMSALYEGATAVKIPLRTTKAKLL